MRRLLGNYGLLARYLNVLALAAGCVSIAVQTGPALAQVSGELQQWHKVSIDFTGPETSETDSTNPFSDYRLDVEFTSPLGRTVTVAGFYAADSNAAETHAAAGRIWRVNFLPDEVGAWSYIAKFESGANVAIASAFGTGTTAFAGSFHGAAGDFTISASDKTGRDFRAAENGLLRNTGNHYLTFAGSGKAWVKGGPDIPENFLGYAGFDNTSSQNSRGPQGYGDYLHRYPDHVSDWSPGDPTFTSNNPVGSDLGAQGGKGIIGAINYVADKGGNSLYFLPMNLGGDGQDTFPTISPAEKTRYDVSKLDQWEIVFEHAQQNGVMLHFQLNETESGNENYHDNGTLGTERKLYYRELIARFAHHPAVQFNLGEENDFGDAKHKQFAAYIKQVDPYDHPVTTHTKTNQFDAYYDAKLGSGDFDMTSFQATAGGLDLDDAGNAENVIQEWRRRSAESGQPWMVSVDEPQTIQNNADGYESARKQFLWPTYLSGAGGFEWYVQEDGGGHGLDQEIESFALMEDALTWTGHALDFLEQLPLLEMNPDDQLLRGEDSDFGGAKVLVEPGQVYALYLPDASNDDNPHTLGEIQAGTNGPPELDLTGYPDTEFRMRWYNPRSGDFQGDAILLEGGDWVSLGVSPDGFRNTSDWAATITLVPEPSTYTLLAAAALCAFILWRRGAFGWGSK